MVALYAVHFMLLHCLPENMLLLVLFFPVSAACGGSWKAAAQQHSFGGMQLD